MSEGCGKYIKEEDRNCGNWYNFKDMRDQKNFINKEDFGMGGIYLCPECQKKNNSPQSKGDDSSLGSQKASIMTREEIYKPETLADTSKIKEEIYKELEQGIKRNDILPLDWAMDRIMPIIDEALKKQSDEFKNKVEELKRKTPKFIEELMGNLENADKEKLILFGKMCKFYDKIFSEELNEKEKND